VSVSEYPVGTLLRSGIGRIVVVGAVLLLIIPILGCTGTEDGPVAPPSAASGTRR